LGLSVLLTPALTATSFAQDRPPVRDVTPPGVNRIYQSTPSAPAAVMVPTDKYEGAKLRNDGSIVAEGRVLALKGVTLPERTKICGVPGVVRWACGIRAHGALRVMIDRRILDCEKAEAGSDARSPMLVTCWIDRKDLALTLLEQGWVYLAESGKDLKGYEAAAAVAKASRAGLWGDNPPPDTQARPKRPLAIP
jgi:endonuclease YncB( thermonuclease family)